MNSVAIIGGGITGLAAAYGLRRKNIPVQLYEARSRVGGVIGSTRRDGFLAESGPNTILLTSPKIKELIDDLGLGPRLLYSDRGATARYLVFKGRPVALPSTPLGFFTTSLFSPGAKMSLLREPFIPRGGERDESVADFVRRRLGEEFLERAVDPLVAGIYAGNPERLSVKHAFPRLARAELEYGSLIKSQIFCARSRQGQGEVSRDRAPKFSFDEGLEVLVVVLAAKLGNTVNARHEIRKIEANREGGWTIHGIGKEGGFSTSHRAILYAGTAYQLAALEVVGVSGRVETQAFQEIPYPPVASVVLGFKREQVRHPVKGFGMLVPAAEKLNILGTIFSSSLFPNRAPLGHVLLTSYIGGERQPHLAIQSQAELTSLVMTDLKKVLGVRGDPVFAGSTVYPKAIPQYNLGHERFQDMCNDIERRCGGLFLAGNFRDGVALSDSILAGMRAAERMEKWLAPSQGGQPAQARELNLKK